MRYFSVWFIFFLATPAMSQQEAKGVDFRRMEAAITIHPKEKEVVGTVILEADILKPVDSMYVDAEDMKIHQVLLNDRPANYSYTGKKVWIKSSFLPGEDYQLSLKYTAQPSQAMYFINKAPKGNPPEYQVWTQGQGKNTSHWLPSFNDPSEKLEFDLKVSMDRRKRVIANGTLQKTVPVGDSLIRWEFDMERPMSSYLVALAAGDYEVIEVSSEDGVPMQMFYPSGMDSLVEPTYRYSTRIMDFLVQEIGFPYPWQNYKQVPVQDFLYAGMENTGTTIFSDLFLIDSLAFRDRNYVNVNAHELAHQWFGNLVTAETGADHWLQEGFATYYALLAERDIFGEDYFYWKLFQSAEELKSLSDTGKGEALRRKGGSSLTYYQKGAWALHILKEKVGKAAFDRAVVNYLEKNQFGSVTSADFIVEVEKASGDNLKEFVADWLDQSAFQATEVLASLKKSSFINDYLELASLKPLPIGDKKHLLKKYLTFPVNDYLGQEVVYQLSLEEPAEVMDLYRMAFRTNNWYIRQAIALSLDTIPDQLKSEYQTLLEDPSYVTREAALYNLWLNFPEDRKEYLQKLKGVTGFSDKNIETLWLALNLVTQGEQEEVFLKRLITYTAPHQRFQLRQNAFNYLYQLRAFDLESLRNLLEARTHHNSRFRSFARNLSKKLLEEGHLDPEEKQLLETALAATK